MHVEEGRPEGLEGPGHADAAQGHRDVPVGVSERFIHPRRRPAHDDVEGDAHRQVKRGDPEKGGDGGLGAEFHGVQDEGETTMGSSPAARKAGRPL